MASTGTVQDADDVARTILRTVFRHRRGALAPDCGAEGCEACRLPHLDAVRASVAAGAPVVFVLPGFPCKSPNPAKVLGALPDLAEDLALAFLAGLCRDIQAVYPPGAHLVVCSDGRVFSDLINVPDCDVTAYQDEIRLMAGRRGPESLSLFTIDDMAGMASLPHATVRRRLDDTYGESPQRIRDEVRAGGEPLRLYRALTRFLFEDALDPGRDGSRSALQRAARRRAYGVIRRSRAWGALVADRFPGAVRLSIHPQPCGSPKFGIRLASENDGWLTPWHGVAVETGDGFVLRRRAETEGLGAQLIHRDGRPSHYVLGASGGATPGTAARIGQRRPPRTLTTGRI